MADSSTAAFFLNLVALGSRILQTAVFAGLIVVTLRKLRGEKVSLDTFLDVFSDLKTFGIYFLAMILYVIMTILGSIFLLIPGIYLAAKYLFAPTIAIDGRAGVFGSFQKAGEMIEDNLTAAVLFIITNIAAFVASFLTLGLASIFTVPYLAVVGSHLYYSALEDSEDSVEEFPK
jgi:uncharacterized membrane protein